MKCNSKINQPKSQPCQQDTCKCNEPQQECYLPLTAKLFNELEKVVASASIDELQELKKAKLNSCQYTNAIYADISNRIDALYAAENDDKLNKVTYNIRLNIPEQTRTLTMQLLCEYLCNHDGVTDHSGIGTDDVIELTITLYDEDADAVLQYISDLVTIMRGDVTSTLIQYDDDETSDEILCAKIRLAEDGSTSIIKLCTALTNHVDIVSVIVKGGDTEIVELEITTSSETFTVLGLFGVIQHICKECGCELLADEV